MLVSTTVLILLSIVTFILYKKVQGKNSKKSPPGPKGWPLVGYLPYMDPRTPYTDIEKLVRKFGPIITVQMGSWNTVIIADYDLIRKAFAHPGFSSRPNGFLVFDLFSHGGHGLAASNGNLWHEQRRFALRHLRDLGMGKSSIETHIREEALAIINILKQSVGQPTDLSWSLNIAITNIVWGIAAGKRMRHDDPTFLGLIDAINLNFQQAGKFGAVAFLPWIAKWLPKSLLGLKRLEDTVEKFENYVKELISEHKKKFNADSIEDFIDYFLDEMKKNNPTFTDVQLLVTLGDLFVAGGETTSTTLRWAILLLSKHPQVQQRMQQEIDQVVGRNRLPALDDRERMPYTDAVIHEIQRFADIAPLGVLHGTQEDVEFEGYVIPKDSLVMAFLGHAHRSEEYWEKPFEFYPEHFLDSQMKLRRNVQGFFPFSTGRRQCLGEGLARAELFVFLTYLFQAFNFQLADEPEATLEPSTESGLIRWPSPYRVILQQRV